MTDAPTVVVVETGGESETPPAGAGAPQYVTAGELDARLELFKNEVSASVSTAMEEAWRARDAAEDARDEAAVATAVAVEAAAAVDEATDDDTDGDEEQPEVEEEAPKPPAKREPAVASSNVKGGSGSGKSRGYGANWLTR